MKRQQHTCGAPGCIAAIGSTHVMCHAHWRRLPNHLRLAITTAWNACRNRDWTDAVMDARRWHRDNPPISSAALAARIIGERL